MVDLSNNSMDNTCQQCGYSLRGLLYFRCPECGAPFSPGDPIVPSFPWEQRRPNGRVIAWIRTIAFWCMRPSRFINTLVARVDIPIRAPVQLYIYTICAFALCIIQ